MTTASVSNAERYTSRLDPQMAINQNEWAVTLIRVPNKNHAQLVIEGIDEKEQQFLKVAHLIGKFTLTKAINYGRVFDFALSHNYVRLTNFGFEDQGEVKLADIDPAKLKFGGKTETWQRARNLVALMLTQIENEKNQPAEHPIAFNILGDDSIYAQTKYNVDGCVKELPSLMKIDTRAVKLAEKLFPGTSEVNATLEQNLANWWWKDKNPQRVETHSCFTWARAKLRMINVDLPLSKIGWLVSPTKEYTH